MGVSDLPQPGPPAHVGAGRAYPSSTTLRAAILVLTLVTFFAFSGSLENDLVDWDDLQNLVRNEEYQGFGGQQLRWMFTTGFAGHYQPLTWLSFAVDWYLFGPTAWGFHFTNLLLHTATSVGFYFIARRLLAAALPRRSERSLIVGALMAALLFAVHPLRVESVAWATERRDVLSGAWLMGATLLYLRAVEPRRASRRGLMLTLTCLCFLLSLLSKAAGITWPIALLILDVYPLRRLATGRIQPSESSRGLKPAARWRRILLEKALFACPAIVIGLVALWAQAATGALRTLAEHSLSVRIGQACYGLMFYLWKTLWPAGLVPLYEQHPSATAWDASNVVGACVVVTLTILCWRLRRRTPALLAAWGVYVVTVSPVLGLAQSGPQVVADRYSYLSCLPWAVLAGGSVAILWAESTRRRRWLRAATVSASIVIVAALVVLTRSQTRIWADSLTLWTTIVERAWNTPTAHSNLAIVLNGRGEYENARRHCLEALRILPGNRSAHIALARACTELGDLTTAEKHYRIAIDLSEAIGKTDPGTLVRLAYVKSEQGDDAAAERLYRSVIALESGVATWHYNLGGFLASRDRRGEAVEAFRDALQVDPTYSEARFRLAVLLRGLGHPAAAITTLEEGLSHTPEDPMLLAKLAWILSTCEIDELRDGPRALQLARQAARHAHERPIAVGEALAAALAETGDFPSAQGVLGRLLAEVAAVVPEKTRRRVEAQLDLYQQRKPLRE